MSVPSHVYKILVCDKPRSELEEELRRLGYDPSILKYDELTSTITGKECYEIQVERREDFVKISSAIV